jgi:hypothetical protein
MVPVLASSFRAKITPAVILSAFTLRARRTRRLEGEPPGWLCPGSALSTGEAGGPGAGEVSVLPSPECGAGGVPSVPAAPAARPPVTGASGRTAASPSMPVGGEPPIAPAYVLYAARRHLWQTLRVPIRGLAPADQARLRNAARHQQERTRSETRRDTHLPLSEVTHTRAL